jgi:hypothetical protein
MKEKINVLVLPSDKTGVGKFRSVDPHVFLQNLYPDDFHVDIDYEPQINNIEYWKKYQIVHAHRTIGMDYDMAPQIIEWLKSIGVVVIVDLDDYWLPTKEHPIHNIIVQNKIDEKIKNNLRVASYVTTTTDIFADEIKKLNKNVIVFPNAINPKELQFNQPTPPSDKIRVGWLGGSSHLHDLELLGDFVQKNQDINDKLQYVICGFDTRGTVTEINPQTGEQKQRDILPHETVWARYEEFFTSNYRTIDDDYKKFLLEFKEGDSAIVPVMLYDAKLSQVFADKLLLEGIYVIGFFFPVVAKGQARIRVQLSAAHTKAYLDKALAAFEKVGKELGVIK